MKPLIISELSSKSKNELKELFRTTKVPRMRTRAQIILLSNQGYLANQIAEMVLMSTRTVQRWINRYQSEGLNGLYDVPRSGAPSKATAEYKSLLLETVRRRPRSLELPFSLWTCERLADYMAEQTGIRLSRQAVNKHLNAMEIVMSRPQHKISSPDPDYMVKKRRLK